MSTMLSRILKIQRVNIINNTLDSRKAVFFSTDFQRGGCNVAGRPRKALGLATGKIGKQEKLNRQVQEQKLKLDIDDLNHPEWLSEFGQEEFCKSC